MTTVVVPQEWPSGVPARSGLPARDSLPIVLDAQGMYLCARRRYGVYVQLSRGHSEPVDDSHLDSAKRIPIRMRVPAWCVAIRWGVVCQGDDAHAFAYAQRSEVNGAADAEAHSHRILASSVGGDSLAVAGVVVSDSFADADDEPQHVEARDSAEPVWSGDTVEFWIADAEVHGAVFEFLAEDEVTG